MISWYGTCKQDKLAALAIHNDGSETFIVGTKEGIARFFQTGEKNKFVQAVFDMKEGSFVENCLRFSDIYEPTSDQIVEASIGYNTEKTVQVLNCQENILSHYFAIAIRDANRRNRQIAGHLIDSIRLFCANHIAITESNLVDLGQILENIKHATKTEKDMMFLGEKESLEMTGADIKFIAKNTAILADPIHNWKISYYSNYTISAINGTEYVMMEYDSFFPLISFAVDVALKRGGRIRNCCVCKRCKYLEKGKYVRIPYTCSDVCSKKNKEMTKKARSSEYNKSGKKTDGKKYAREAALKYASRHINSEQDTQKKSAWKELEKNSERKA